MFIRVLVFGVENVAAIVVIKASIRSSVHASHLSSQVLK